MDDAAIAGLVERARRERWRRVGAAIERVTAGCGCPPDEPHAPECLRRQDDAEREALRELGELD
jgi:hypothetical protein